MSLAEVWRDLAPLTFLLIPTMQLNPPNRLRFELPVLALLCASALPAQITFPITISDSCGGNTGTFTLRSLPSSATEAFATVGNADFGASGSCAPDVMYGHYPLIRFEGDSRNVAFYDSGVPGDQGGIAVATTPDMFTITWPDVDNRGLLAATWCARIRCCGTNGTFVEHDWTFQYIGTGSKKITGGGKKVAFGSETFDFFAYSDLDMAGVFGGNESDAASGPDRHLITQPTCPDEVAEFWGDAPLAWEVAPWPALANALVLDPFPGLSNGGLPFGPDDYTGCMAWTRTVGDLIKTLEGPIRYSHSVNCLECSVDPVVGGGGVGSASIATASLGSLGSPIDLSITGGQPSSPGSILFGLPSAAVPLALVFPGCTTETLYVSSPLSTLPIVTDPAGDATFVFPGLFAPSLCGTRFDFQYGALDFFAACPIVLSDYLSVTFGREQLGVCSPY